MTGPGLPAAGPESEVRLSAWVHGHVQGVGFRWWTRSRALELGLTGFCLESARWQGPCRGAGIAGELSAIA